MRIAPYCFDGESASQELIEALQTNLRHLPHGRLFRWLYLRNPEGHARVWAATDSHTGRIIGVAAAFPRRAYYHGNEVRGYILGDFCVDASQRSVGLALELQRACLEGLSNGGTVFVFDFPSRAMSAIYKRLRIEVNGALIRYAKPLRSDRKLFAAIPFPPVARVLSAAVNVGLRLGHKRVRITDRWIIAAEEGPYGDEFTQAARQWSSRTGICVARTAEYLNWRYREHPLQQYEMLTARQGSRLCGYLIQHSLGEDYSIADLFAEDDETRCALLGQAVRTARRRRIHTLSIPWLAAHPGTLLLENCGFRPRESSPVVLLPLPIQRQTSPGEDWFLTSGDWES
jgi:GNAT superfamily N-acetyltransferase